MKDGWFEISKGETPETIIGFHKKEGYRTEHVERRKTQDLHYMTDMVLCLHGCDFDHTYHIDARRKFDSCDEWIWWHLEGCDVEYWKPLPAIPLDYFVESDKNEDYTSYW